MKGIILSKKKLKALDITISKQQLSNIWRNPFYCGICVHKMLKGEAVKGKWEKMVSEEDFMLVQEILKGNRQGYKQEKTNSDRPLNGHLLCNNCGAKMVGYEVKKKKLHYYKCLNCKGVSINANSTKKTKNKGAHDLYVALMEQYSLSDKLVEPFKEQLKLTFEMLNDSSADSAKDLNKNLEKCKTDLKEVNKRWATGKITEPEVYAEVKNELMVQINEIEKQLQNTSMETSNLKKYIDTSLTVAQNINKYWFSGDIETKKRIQNLVFPEGVSLDMKNRSYLTKKVNMVFSLIQSISGVSSEKEKGLQPFFDMQSSVVAGLGLEPRTFGL